MALGRLVDEELGHRALDTGQLADGVHPAHPHAEEPPHLLVDGDAGEPFPVPRVVVDGASRRAARSTWPRPPPSRPGSVRPSCGPRPARRPAPPASPASPRRRHRSAANRGPGRRSRRWRWCAGRPACRPAGARSRGHRSGTRNMVRPLCLGTSGLVRARTKTCEQTWAVLVNIFWPLITHSSPSLTARVLAAATSEPESGSE